MSVDVLIPCYNPNKWLFESIESIIEQTFQDWNLFVVNDGEGLNGHFLIASERYKDRRIKFLRLRNNIGQSAVRNLLLLLGTGKYLTFLDQDDKKDKDMLSDCFEYLENNKQIDLVHTNISAIDENSVPIINKYNNENNNRNNLNYEKMNNIDLNLTLLKSLSIRMSCFVLSRNAFTNIRGFDFRTTGSEEMDFFHRFSIKYSIGHIRKELCIRRVHRLSQSNLDQTRLVGRIKYLKKLSNDPHLSSITQRRYERSLRSLVLGNPLRFKKSELVRISKKLFYSNPFSWKFLYILFITIAGLENYHSCIFKKIVKTKAYES